MSERASTAAGIRIGPLRSYAWVLVLIATLLVTPAWGKKKRDRFVPAPWPVAERQELFREKAAAYPEAPAVVLRDDTVWQFEKRKVIKTHRLEILILTDRGFGQANRSVTYYETEKIKSFHALTRRLDGRDVPVASQLVSDTVEYQDAGFLAQKKRLAFPAVDVGSLLVLDLQIEMKSLDTWPVWHVQQSIPVERSSRTFHFKGRYYRMKAFSRAPADPWCEDRRFKKEKILTFDFSCKDIPPFVRESNAPPDADLRLVRLIVPRGAWDVAIYVWERLNRDKYVRIQEFLASQSLAKAKARELSAASASPSEILDRLREFIDNEIDIDYESKRKGLEGKAGEAASVDAVLSSGRGLPNEVTIVAQAILNAAGIEAQPILVGDRSHMRVDGTIPEHDQLTHMMLQVNIEGKVHFFDPVCRYCHPGIPSWRYSAGRGSGLVINGFSSAFEVTIPKLPAKYSSEIRERKVRLDPNGDAYASEFFRWSGHEETRQRERWSEMSHDERAEDLTKLIRGEIDRLKTTIGDPQERGAPLEARVDYRSASRSQRIDDQILISGFNDFTHRLPIPLLRTREWPLWWGYGRSVQSTTKWEIPEGFTVVSMPEPIVIEGPDMSFKGRWVFDSDMRELQSQGVLIVDGEGVDAASYEQARDFHLRLRWWLRNGAVLSENGLDTSKGL